MKVTGVSGLIGTQDYLIPFKRTSDKALELTPSWRKTNYNGFDVTDIPVAGLIPVAVTFNGENAGYKYKTITFGSAISADKEVVLPAADYALIEEGVYYTNEATGELFYCKYKGEGYKVSLSRGLMGTTAAGITTSDSVIVMNTILLDSASGSETLGVFTLEAGTAPLASGDSISIALDGIVKTYVIGTDIAVGTDAATQAANIAAALAQDFKEWGFTVSTADVVATQKVGYAHPFALLFQCEAATAANAYTHDASSDTAGVAKTYNAGYGYVIYKEFARNLANGQPVYPAYNYNVDGR